MDRNRPIKVDKETADVILKSIRDKNDWIQKTQNSGIDPDQWTTAGKRRLI